MSEVIWDQTRLDIAVERRIGALHSNRTPAQIVNTTLYWIAVNTKNNMPSVEVGRIDAELAVTANPVYLPRVSKRGFTTWRLSKDKRRKYDAAKFGKNVSVTHGGKTAMVPLAVLIIQAQVNPFSRYNQLTGGRWQRDASPWKGKSRRAGQVAMYGAMKQLLASRHSSTHYLLSAWIPVIQALLPFTAQKSRPGSGRPLSDAPSFHESGEPRFAVVVAGGGLNVQGMIENATGTFGPNSQSQNAALFRYGGPPFAAAIDLEIAGLDKKTAELMAKDNLEFNELCN